ncbi:hypothetical protein [Bradyrhizobium sp. 157]|uniref:hypothetical protein n=1 Tax=Bradyrhizobium sp. 157 TaxID=2782631 RepID=UPI001FF7D007|nr:hypothetical protein [Bradyrhizobium sp. 157]
MDDAADSHALLREILGEVGEQRIHIAFRPIKDCCDAVGIDLGEVGDHGLDPLVKVQGTALGCPASPAFVEATMVRSGGSEAATSETPST